MPCREGPVAKSTSLPAWAFGYPMWVSQIIDCLAAEVFNMLVVHDVGIATIGKTMSNDLCRLDG